ncbi:MAG: hypothetical protein Q8R55_07305 [Candidatus Taylorbacteria bacterium]|nr:hypothetical protein [Candidatus Taylorbacteria bacterium]
MKQIVKFKSKREHYKADACIVWCFDDRFTGLLGELNQFGFKNVDLVKIAGGAMGLTGRGSAGNDNAINYIADQVEKSIKLHNTPLVILMLHKDCGAYKAIGLPMKGENESELLKDDLELARRILAEYLETKGYKPRIKTYLADFNGLWEVE